MFDFQPVASLRPLPPWPLPRLLTLPCAHPPSPVAMARSGLRSRRQKEVPSARIEENSSESSSEEDTDGPDSGEDLNAPHKAEAGDRYRIPGSQFFEGANE